jgi:hypothetical protein
VALFSFFTVPHCNAMSIFQFPHAHAIIQLSHDNLQT